MSLPGRVENGNEYCTLNRFPVRLSGELTWCQNITVQISFWKGRNAALSGRTWLWSALASLRVGNQRVAPPLVEQYELYAITWEVSSSKMVNLSWMKPFYLPSGLWINTGKGEREVTPQETNRWNQEVGPSTVQLYPVHRTQYNCGHRRGLCFIKRDYSRHNNAMYSP